MRYFTVFLLLLSVTQSLVHGIDNSTNSTSLLAPGDKAENKSSCPPWFLYNETSSECQCGNALGGIVKCIDKKHDPVNAIMDYYCMTVDEAFGTIVGLCIYNCDNHRGKTAQFDYDPLYQSLPLNTSMLNEVMCGNQMKRTGRLCGDCMKGYQLPAYSYNLECVQCDASATRSWIMYICMAFLPLTAFFVFVLVFRISAVSPQMMTYVMLAQAFSSPDNIRILTSALTAYPKLLNLAKVVVTMYAIWNLDFFRAFSPPICLGIDTLQVLALDYVIAVYPLVLIMLAYMLIQLHARGCVLISILWLPFRRCHHQFQKTINPKTSIIDIFASFLVLSYIKVLCVTSDLLIPTQVYNVHGEKMGLFLYYNANLEYFGPKHLPYGIIALFMCFFFIILPLVLLFLYPLRCFQRCCGSWQALRIFIDSFQGSYKNGVGEGRYDCRWFSMVYLITRVAFFVLYASTLSGYYYAAGVTMMVLIVLLVFAVRPYRRALSSYTRLDVFFLLMIALWYSTLVSSMISSSKALKSLKFSVALSGIFGCLPLLYIPTLLLKKVWSGSPKLRSIIHSTPCIDRLSSTASMTPDDDNESWILPQSTKCENYGALNK